MALTSDVAKQLVELGVSLKLENIEFETHEEFTLANLEEILEIAQTTGAHITLKGDYTQPVLLRLGKIGRNNLTVIVKEKPEEVILHGGIY